MIIGGAGLLVVLLLLVSLIRRGTSETFPGLPNGTFVGSISGLPPNPSESATLYVERIARTNAILLLVFRSGWKPQLVQLEAIETGNESSGGERIHPSAPVNIRSGATIFSLSGSGGDGEYGGRVAGSNHSKGEWKLKMVPISEIRDNVFKQGADISLSDWLQTKAKYRTVARDLEVASQDLREKENKYKKLSSFVGEGGALQTRSDTQRDELSKALGSLAEDQEKRGKTVKEMVRQLDQLTRITRRGQTVDLERRISKREEKWYLVNWQVGEDSSVLEENMAHRMNIDLAKLNENAKKAREMQNLKSKLLQEQDRVLKLEKLYDSKVRDGSPGSPPSQLQREPGKPWWKSWEGLFG